MSTPISDIQKEVNVEPVVENKNNESSNFLDMIDYKNMFLLFISSFLSTKLSFDDMPIFQRFLQYQDVLRSLFMVLLYYVFKFFLA